MRASSYENFYVASPTPPVIPRDRLISTWMPVLLWCKRCVARISVISQATRFFNQLALRLSQVRSGLPPTGRYRRHVCFPSACLGDEQGTACDPFCQLMSLRSIPRS